MCAFPGGVFALSASRRTVSGSILSCRFSLLLSATVSRCVGVCGLALSYLGCYFSFSYFRLFWLVGLRFRFFDWLVRVRCGLFCFLSCVARSVVFGLMSGFAHLWLQCSCLPFVCFFACDLLLSTARCCCAFSRSFFWLRFRVLVLRAVPLIWSFLLMCCLRG